MAIHFDKARLAQVLENHTRWWEGTLGRPLARVVISDAYAAPKRTPAPVLSQRSCTAMEWSPDQVIDALDEALSWEEYLGDAYPMVNFDAFGPGVLAAMCGEAKLDNSSGGVWFFPSEEKALRDIHVRYDPDNVWVRRIKAIYRAGYERWEGAVVMGMPDLGGVMDVIAALRGSENLLLDLYDEPEEVSRLVVETEAAWREAFNDLHAAMGQGALYTDWNGLLSATPSYIIQCDFCYMIGNDMFHRFVLDTLRRDTEALDHTMYHLDGIGELNHLGDVCALEKLNAVQWVFGDGKPGPAHWLDVYHKILGADKQIMIVGSGEDYLSVLPSLHGAPYVSHRLPGAQRALAERIVKAR